MRLSGSMKKLLVVLDVVGIVIGTRPDCMPQALLDYLTGLNRRTFLMVEYGIESVDDGTLVRINRGHTFAETEETVRRTVDAGIRDWWAYHPRAARRSVTSWSGRLRWCPVCL